MGAAAASGLHADLVVAGQGMKPAGTERLPDPARQAFYDRDYRRFLAMLRHRAELEAME